MTVCPFIKGKSCKFPTIPCPLLRDFDEDIECYDLPENQFEIISKLVKK